MKFSPVCALFSIAITSVLFTSQVTAFETVTVKPLASNTDQEKNRLMAKLTPLSFFSATFTQVVTDVEGALVQESKGNLAVVKPNLVNWHTTEPDETQIVSDGETLWFFDPFVEQATAYNFADSIINTPILLLTSNEKTLWDNYRVTEVSDDNYLIHALQSDSQIQTLELIFKNQKITGFIILDATGQLSEISLHNVDFVNKPNNEQFNFSLPDGVYLDDQR